MIELFRAFMLRRRMVRAGFCPDCWCVLPRVRGCGVRGGRRG